MTPLFSSLLDALDERLQMGGTSRVVARKVFPENWSFLLGEVAAISFLVLVITGIFLTLFFRPSVDPVVYEGSSALFHGEELPAAFASVLNMTHDVPGGLLIRRIHRAASHLFIASMVLHMLRVLMTGAFRKPRELNYYLGLALLGLAFGEGLFGYSLPYDSLAGTGIRVTYSIMLAMPYIGDQVAFAFFGGDYPSAAIIPRMYAFHVFILPLTLMGLIGAHIGLLVKQKHTQFPSAMADGHTYVVGKPLWPGQIAESLSLLLWQGGILVASATLVPWSDVTLLGPYVPAEVGNNAQPDWFMFWTEGLVRTVPAVEFTVAGATITSVFIAGMVIPGLLFGILILYPTIEAKFYKLEGNWHVLTNPLDIPLRAAMLVSVFSFVILASANAANDVISRMSGIPLETLVNLFRVLIIVVPVGLGGAFYWGCNRRIAARGAVVATSETLAESRF